ncbi:protein of unknown function [Georgfuchsia toluolica]|uniref:Uncharacterized protein n=1 Tax=Georgfuchsia toluolica TaxID=424218 RepID=A0A916J6D8_9PROT|nr:hypothetical protein [Georgfuchsia toluolica]CAG4884765.1 protein of unknown function [Georgfuchsia toluolica]
MDLTMARNLQLLITISLLLVPGCAGNDAQGQQQPLDRQLLPDAQGVGYDALAEQTPQYPALYCITTGGSCVLVTPADTGLSCTCDSNNPKYSYGGRTGSIQPSSKYVVVATGREQTLR